MAAPLIRADKLLAGAGMSGNFGVSSYPGRADKHPDIGMSHECLPDSARSAPIGEKQGAPDHGIGTGVSDHFTRGGKA